MRKCIYKHTGIEIYKKERKKERKGKALTKRGGKARPSY
jgi:hypothetical protein